MTSYNYKNNDIRNFVQPGNDNIFSNSYILSNLNNIHSLDFSNTNSVNSLYGFSTNNSITTYLSVYIKNYPNTGTIYTHPYHIYTDRNLYSLICGISNGYYIVIDQNGNLYLRYLDTQYKYVTCNIKLDLNTWYYLAITREINVINSVEINQTTKVYVDGVFLKTLTHTASYGVVEYFYFGAIWVDDYDYGFFFDYIGSMHLCNIQIWEEISSDTFILNNKNRVLPISNYPKFVENCIIGQSSGSLINYGKNIYKLYSVYTVLQYINNSPLITFINSYASFNSYDKNIIGNNFIQNDFGYRYLGNTLQYEAKYNEYIGNSGTTSSTILTINGVNFNTTLTLSNGCTAIRGIIIGGGGGGGNGIITPVSIGSGNNLKNGCNGGSGGAMYFDISNLSQNQVISITVGGGGAGGYITRQQGIAGNSSSISFTMNTTTYILTAYGGNGGYAGAYNPPATPPATASTVNGGNTLITNTYNFSTTTSYNGKNGNNISLGTTICNYPTINTSNYYVNATLYGGGGKGGLARTTVAGNFTSNLGYGGTGGYVRIYQMI